MLLYFCCCMICLSGVLSYSFTMHGLVTPMHIVDNQMRDEEIHVLVKHEIRVRALHSYDSGESNLQEATMRMKRDEFPT